MKHLPPHLQRRSFLKLGIGAAVVLAVAGGAVALIKPPWSMAASAPPRGC